jgi:paraquat-inducible protein B
MLVVIGIALAIGFILFLTSGGFGTRQVIFETYVRESVAGLEVGAPVRFRGVAVGRVTELGLTSVVYGVSEGGAENTANRLVLIRFALDPSRYGNSPVEEAVRAGLRVRMASTGVTGVSYLEADFVNPERFPPIEVPWTPAFPYIPSIPSTISQVTSAAEQLMSRLSGVDLEALFGSATQLIEDLRNQVGGQGDLAVTLREAAATMTALREAIEGAELAATVRDLRTAANNIGGAGQAAEQLLEGPAIAGAVDNIGRAAADLRTAIARLPAVIQTLELALRSVRGTTSDAQADLGPLLRDLRATASSLRDTAEALRRSPSQSLFGQPPPPPPRDRR